MNINIGYKPGLESLITEQLNDPVCDYIQKLHGKLTKLNNLYTVKKSISKKELATEFKRISNEAMETFADRFGVKIAMVRSNTFAIIPLVNINNLDVGALRATGKSVKKAIAEVKRFNKWMETNSVIIDKHKAYVHNVPSHNEVQLFISLKDLDALTKEEFTSIILHEIGHLFTLLEMFNTTTATTSTLLNNFLRGRSIIESAEKLRVGNTNDGAPIDEPSALISLSNGVTKKVRDLGLGSHNTGQVNSEYEADNFTTKFGYASPLSSALVKLNYVSDLSFTMTAGVVVFITTARILTSALILTLALPGGIAVSAALILNMGVLIHTFGKSVASHSGRNPINDEHGSLKDRLEHIRNSLVETIRHADIDNATLKDLVKQFESIENDLELLDKSAYGTLLASLLSEYLSGNLNTEDELAGKLNTLLNTKLYVQEAKFGLGMESINYQGKKDPVINKLITFFAKVQDNSIIKNMIDLGKINQELNDITFERFGLPIVTLPAKGISGGWACMPFNVVRQQGISDWRTYFNKSGIDPTSIQVTIMKYILSVHNNRTIMEDLTKGLKLTVDLNKGRIDGFSQSKHTNIVFMEYGRDMFGTKIDAITLTPEESTAVFLHEVGHLFTYVESMSRLVTSNTLLLDSFKNRNDKLGKLPIKYKEEYKEDADEMLTGFGYLVGSIKQYVAAAFLAIASTVRLVDKGIGESILTDLATKDNRLGGVQSFMTDSEVVADDFSTKMGMGKELVSALDKMITMGVRSRSLVMLPMLVMLSTSIILKIVIRRPKDAAGVFLFSLLFTIKYIVMVHVLSSIYRIVAGQYFPYEKLPERFDSVSRSLIKALREENLDKETVKEIVNSIEEVKRIKKEIDDSGYGSLLLSMFIPNRNLGKNITLDGRIVDSLDKLINNDMVYQSYRYAMLADGNEAMSDNVLPDVQEATVYYQEIKLWSERINKILGDNDLVNINETLKQYGIGLEKHGKEILLKSSKMLKLADGYTGFTVYETDSEDKPKNKTVVTITIDNDKVLWQLLNPYIKVYNVNGVSIGHGKYVYVVELEYLTYNADKMKITSEIYKAHGDAIMNIGDADIDEMLTELEDTLSEKKIVLPTELTEQLDLIRVMYKSEEIKGKLRLDLHSGNWGLNSDGKLVIFDPFVNDTGLGLKVTNYIDLDKHRDKLVNVSVGVEHINITG